MNRSIPFVNWKTVLVPGSGFYYLSLIKGIIMRLIKLLATLIFSFAITACGGPEERTSILAMEEESREQITRRSLRAEEVLDLIARGSPNRPVDLPPGTSQDDIEAGLRDLQNKIRPKPNNLAELEVDEEFEKRLNPGQRGALNRLRAEFERNVRQGNIKVSQRPDGTLDVKELGVKTQGEGIGRNRSSIDESDDEIDLRHAVGNGYWSWNYSTHWWGRKLYVNHNFLFYLCEYTSWILSNSGLPSWAKSVLQIILCAPHRFDSGSDGATVYVTWAGVFWYSP